MIPYEKSFIIKSLTCMNILIHASVSHTVQHIPGDGRPSLMLNAVAKMPKGKAPIPKDIWKPPSPKPKP